MRSRHTVTAPLVVVPGPDGDRFLYAGGDVPGDVDDTLLERLLEKELVAVKKTKQRAGEGEE